jgi:hypothetical protein
VDPGVDHVSIAWVRLGGLEPNLRDGNVINNPTRP